MTIDDTSDAADSVINYGQLDGQPVDPAFRDMLIRISAGELTVDEAMRQLRQR